VRPHQRLCLRPGLHSQDRRWAVRAQDRVSSGRWLCWQPYVSCGERGLERDGRLLPGVVRQPQHNNPLQQGSFALLLPATTTGISNARVFFAQKCKTDKGCVCAPGNIRTTDGGACVHKTECNQCSTATEVYDDCYHDCENSCSEPAQICTRVCLPTHLILLSDYNFSAITRDGIFGL
jgi:hypothetical protein